MTAFLTSICIFSALIATGLTLNCYRCLSIEGEPCPDFSDACNEGEICVTKLENSTVENDVRLGIFKGCEKYDPRICGKLFYFTSDGFTFNFYAECCKEDNCNSGSITVPAINTTENGLACPSCYVTGAPECPKTGTIKCVGDQKQCVDYSGILRRPGLPFKEVAAKGCTVAETCEIGFPELKALTNLEHKRFQCY